jgi:hypothetical protein
MYVGGDSSVTRPAERVFERLCLGICGSVLRLLARRYVSHDACCPLVCTSPGPVRLLNLSARVCRRVYRTSNQTGLRM